MTSSCGIGIPLCLVLLFVHLDFESHLVFAMPLYTLMKRRARLVFMISRLTGITSDDDQQVQLCVSLRHIIEAKEVVTHWYLRRTLKPRRQIRQSVIEKSGV